MSATTEPILAAAETLAEAVFQALGAASVCWETPEGAGIFDSDRAKRIGDELVEGIESGRWNPEVSALRAELEIVRTASIGAHALLEDAEAAVERVRALHRPWYEVNGVRHDHRVYVPTYDMDEIRGHECVPENQTDPCEPDEDGHHMVLACIECRQVSDGDDPSFPVWPCPTIAALDGAE